MNKYIIILLSFIVLSLSACSSSDQANSEEKGKAKVISFGHEYSETNPIHEAAVKFKEEVEKLSGGAITVQIHASGSLGTGEEMLQQVRLGNLDANATNLVYLAGEYPQAMVDELPFLYKETQDWYDAMDGKFGDVIQSEIFDKVGVTNVANWGIGFRHFTNNTRPIKVPEDMKGIKFRSASSPIRLKMFESLEANAISMPLTELFTGLQQGTVDGQENPILTINSNSLYEVQKYMSLSGHIFTGMNIVFNTEKWNSFSEEERNWIQTAMDEATKYQRSILAENEKEVLKKLESEIEINEVDYDAFYNAVQPVYDFYREEFGDNGWIEMIQEGKK
jgi:TRAP-type transport system periplasmic protein